MDAKDLYTARVSIKENGEWKLVQSRLYTRMSSAITAVISGDAELYDNVPKENMPTTFKNPVIVTGGTIPDTEWATDIEFHYQEHNLCIWVGTVIIDDEELLGMEI